MNRHLLLGSGDMFTDVMFIIVMILCIFMGLTIGLMAVSRTRAGRPITDTFTLYAQSFLCLMLGGSVVLFIP